MRQKYKHIIVDKTDTIFSVLKKMDVSRRKLMIVMDDRHFVSLISIGDIQRAIIKGIDLQTQIINILREEVFFATTKDDLNQIKERMRNRRNELMPVVAPTGELANVIFWEDLFTDKIIEYPRKKFDLPAVIMAGGVGTRLRPLTNILPKPLIPVNEKTILEDIMDRFVNYGSFNFYLSLNYKADFIKYYLESLKNKNYKVSYFYEEKPLGTIGSLFLLKEKINTTFFVSNCDILIEQDYSEILQYHIKNKNEITIVAAVKHYDIPYGTLTSKENGLLESLKEKPEIIYKINTGFYIFEPQILDEIPENQLYHFTFLIEKLQKQGRRVGVFPVTENSWIDIGNWTEYLKLIQKNT